MQQKIAMDAAIVVPAVSSPLWIHNLNEYAILITLALGIILGVLRVLISWREWMAK